MMRYVLYETDKDTTYLSKELDFIKDYVDLMQLRLTDKVKLILNIQETGEDITIAPMLLLPFIENCFKHGVSSKTESKIEIYIGQKGKVLELKTVNLTYQHQKAVGPNLWRKM